MLIPPNCMHAHLKRISCMRDRTGVHFPALLHQECVLHGSEWGVNQHRDSLAMYVAFDPLCHFFAVAENESVGRVKFSCLQVWIHIPMYLSWINAFSWEWKHWAAIECLSENDTTLRTATSKGRRIVIQPEKVATPSLPNIIPLSMHLESNSSVLGYKYSSFWGRFPICNQSDVLTFSMPPDCVLPLP